MKNLFVIIAIFTGPSVFAQYEHNIQLTNGTPVTHFVTEIDSISFTTDGVPVMHLKLNDGSADVYGLQFIEYVTFSGAPIDDPYPPNTVHCVDGGTEIVEVLNPATGRIWMDRNLGASQVATSFDDELAYGDLYQWGRFSDGHQCRDSETTSTLSSTPQPGHGDFITSSSGASWDWLNPQNDNLWQGVNGLNNPCPEDYRIPTEAELEAERESWSSNDREGAFDSPLKLTAAGFRYYSSGSLFVVGSVGYYWSSTVSGANARSLGFSSSVAGMVGDRRAGGFSVRCIKD